MSEESEFKSAEDAAQRQETQAKPKGRVARIMSAAERAIERARKRREARRRAIERAAERARERETMENARRVNQGGEETEDFST